jgi:hypothetical protein
MDIAGRKIAERCIHGEDVAATHDEFAARRQCRAGRCRLSQSLGRSKPGSGNQSARELEHTAAVKIETAGHVKFPEALTTWRED